MEKEKIFTKENFEDLKSTCRRIILLSDENIDGDLMMSQLLILGNLIKEFKENPIVKNSGII